jgi:arsenite methyltransferase
MAELTDIRSNVRERYAAAANAAAEAKTGTEETGCCGSTVNAYCSQGDAAGVFGAALYDEAAGADLPVSALNASLGCGVPTAVADLNEGETVLDLGSGAGADILISARRVGPTGRAIGLDMTDEMLELARTHAAEAGLENVNFLKGYLEDMPLEDASVDVVISNCVINLSGDKAQVLREASRVLRPGGRFAVSDVIADADMDDTTRADMAAWTGCVAGALTEDEFRSALKNAGFEQIEIHETHRVHRHAGAAIIRARKPLDP